MSARFAVALVLAMVGSCVAAAQSAALEPGVFVSPGSPAGKEYTAPLGALRGQALGHPAREGQQEPLFGIGITPAGAAAQGGAAGAQGTARGSTPGVGKASASRGGRAAGSSRGAGAAGARSGSAARGPATVLPSATEHGSSTFELILLAAVIIFGGAGLGALIVAARRRLG